MALSDRERKILEEIERQLAAEDPDFYRQVQEAAPPGRPGVRRMVLALLFLFGLGLLLSFPRSPLLGALGFLLLALAISGGLGLVRRSWPGRARGGAGGGVRTG